MTIYLEHINLHVHHLAATAEFLLTAFPEFKVRFDSGGGSEEHWIHIGDEHSYFAVYQTSDSSHPARLPYSHSPGFNHVGMVVPAVAPVRQRLLEKGYKETTVPNNHPGRKRVYFADPDGNDWEFIEYLSDDPQLRHDYSDAL